MELKKFRKNNKINTMIIIAVAIVVGLVVSTTLIKSHANFSASKSFNIIQGKIPNKNNGDVTLAVKLDGEKYKEVGFPSKEGHKFKGYDCTNGGVLTWNKETWKATLSDIDKPTVCILEFETIDNTNLVEYLKSTNELTTFTHSNTVQTGSNTKTDYRYTGSDPNNYVKFNNELWRIIGIFNTDDGTGNYEERVKLIRAIGIDNISWDENGTNDWHNATLKILLNGDYYNAENDYSETGLIKEARDQISNTKWYLGGCDTSDITAEDFFGKERGTTTFANSRPTSWIGKVGLMYPSDYGLATSANCSSITMDMWKKYDSVNNSSCYENNWIYYGNKKNEYDSFTSHTWTISPSSGTNNSIFFFQGTNGFAFISKTYNLKSYLLRPVVYLNSKIQTTNGNGEKNTPYEIELTN